MVQLTFLETGFLFLAISFPAKGKAALLEREADDSCLYSPPIDTAKVHDQDFLFDREICGNNLCVDAGVATLNSTLSVICRHNKAVSNFTCSAVTIDEDNNILGHGPYCAFPCHRRSYARFFCPNGALINVFTVFNGSSSFFVQRKNKKVTGSAGFLSQKDGNCQQLSVTGTSDQIGDRLIISCSSFGDTCL